MQYPFSTSEILVKQTNACVITEQCQTLRTKRNHKKKITFSCKNGKLHEVCDSLVKFTSLLLSVRGDGNLITDPQTGKYRIAMNCHCPTQLHKKPYHSTGG